MSSVTSRARRVDEGWKSGEGPSVVVRRPVLHRSDGVPLAQKPLPAWPFDVLLWGYPLWWVLGMMPFIVIIMATIMAALLLARRRVSIVAGVAPFLAFAGWVVASGVMIDTLPRLVGYMQRTANLIAVAIVLLYVLNARERLGSRRVIAGLTTLWVTVVAGGYLGTFFPDVRLTTPMGLLLPGALTGNEYVADLVFPPFAEIQDPWGAPHPYNRPSAPFPYANGWGSAMALLTPLAFAQIVGARRRWTKVLLGLVVLAAVVPTVAALNRGMLIAIAVVVAYVAIRLLARGRIAPFLLVALAGAAGAVSLVTSGVLASTSERANLGSNDSRLALYAETFQRTLHSPVLGWGAPRPSLTQNLSVGTQGEVWNLMFSFGFVGLGLFLWFLVGTTVRTWRVQGAQDLWLHGVLIAACVSIWFYGLDTMQMLTIAVAAAIMLRARVQGEPKVPFSAQSEPKVPFSSPASAEST